MEGTCWHHSPRSGTNSEQGGGTIFCRLQLLSFPRKSKSMTQQKLSYFVCKIVYRVIFKHAHHTNIIINYSNQTAIQTPPQETNNWSGQCIPSSTFVPCPPLIPNRLLHPILGPVCVLPCSKYHSITQAYNLKAFPICTPQLISKAQKFTFLSTDAFQNALVRIRQEREKSWFISKENEEGVAGIFPWMLNLSYTLSSHLQKLVSSWCLFGCGSLQKQWLI